MASSFANAVDFAVPPNPQSGNSPTAPRLEYFENGSNELRRVTIEHSPFRIGRCETSDLRIDSAQVSREHAQIYRRGSIWAIRDLGSTNGTQVNGKPVRESFLSDGDILAIAETEVTFVASAGHAVSENGDAADSIAAVLQDAGDRCRPKLPSCGP